MTASPVWRRLALVGTIIGVHLPRLETGRHEPTLTMLAKLAKALRVKVAELLR